MSIIKNKKNNQRGFTLIEMLVSVTLFSVVLIVILGSIMTIADSNKKARSLMSVTNNLNFAVDSMIRSFKTGDAESNFVTNNEECFETYETDYILDDFGDPRFVEYCLDEGGIKKRVDGGQLVALTSSDVNIEYLKFIDNSIGDQPMLTIVIQGKVKVSEKINSNFSIQTSVSQRKLNI
jgi:prepilin-type N-terminal cleavage/methylation domain-containing protein